MTAEWNSRSPEEHARVEGLVLAQWLPTAVSFSDYWSSRARELGLQADRLTSREDLLRFDTVRERDVSYLGGTGAPALLMRPTEEQVKARASTGMLMDISRSIRQDARGGKRHALLTEYKPIHVHRGGADDDLAIAYTRSDLDRLHRCGARAATVLGLDDSDYLISAVPAGPRLQWWGVYHLALGASIMALHPRGHEDDLAACVDAFSLVPATAVAVTDDDAVEMAVTLVDAGIEVSRIRTVIVVGPPPDDEFRHTIRDAWRAAGASDQVVVRALYAPPEARALWAESREQADGLVTYPDLEVVEVVDAVTGEPTDGAGDLTITSMGWHGTALLRFQTGVYVGGLDRSGAGPGTAPRIVGPVVPGAWQLGFQMPDGSRKHLDLRSAGARLAAEDGIHGWRVEVRGPTAKIDHDRVWIEVGGVLDEATERRLAAGFEEATGIPVDQIKSVADPVVVERKIEEHGSAFADLR